MAEYFDSVVGDDLAKAYDEGYEQGKKDAIQRHGHVVFKNVVYKGKYKSSYAFCSECERELDDVYSYCHYCGAKLDEDAVNIDVPVESW
jgi:hypothetical protein